MLDREDVTGHVWRLGERLIDGLNDSARTHALPAVAFGEPLPPMPFLRFEHADPAINDRLRTSFYTAVIRDGVLLHPRHLWFISQAHTPADIERTLAIADAAMARTREALADVL